MVMSIEEFRRLPEKTKGMRSTVPWNKVISELAGTIFSYHDVKAIVLRYKDKFTHSELHRVLKQLEKKGHIIEVRQDEKTGKTWYGLDLKE